MKSTSDTRSTGGRDESKSSHGSWPVRAGLRTLPAIPAREPKEIMGGNWQWQEPRSDAGGAAPIPTAALLTELNPKTDLAGLVERVARNNLLRVVIPAGALSGWEERDPAGWAKVSAWLAGRGVTIVRI